MENIKASSRLPGEGQGGQETHAPLQGDHEATPGERSCTAESRRITARSAGYLQQGRLHLELGGWSCLTSMIWTVRSEKPMQATGPAPAGLTVLSSSSNRQEGFGNAAAELCVTPILPKLSINRNLHGRERMTSLAGPWLSCDAGP